MGERKRQRKEEIGRHGRRDLGQTECICRVAKEGRMGEQTGREGEKGREKRNRWGEEREAKGGGRGGATDGEKNERQRGGEKERQKGGEEQNT